jgi:hypothetical protein
LQVPALPGSEHDMHEPVHAVWQQVPCTHRPLPHSPPSPQTAPSGLSPHDPLLHTPGGAQSASAVQIDLHAFAPQRNGKHDVAAGTAHVPAPSHIPPGVMVVVFAGQLASLHGVPCA